MNKIILSEECWTIGSFLRSAAAKFDEIAKDCRKPESSPSYASLASTFEEQKKKALEFAELFEQASTVTIETEEGVCLCGAPMKDGKCSVAGCVASAT